jgi:predicted HTH domain antitoxin
MTTQVTLDVPEEALAALAVSPEALPRELLEAAVVRWFEEGRLSQGQSAQLLQLSRGQFLDLLSQHQVSAVQMTVEELEEEFRRG